MCITYWFTNTLISEFAYIAIEKFRNTNGAFISVPIWLHVPYSLYKDTAFKFICAYICSCYKSKSFSGVCKKNCSNLAAILQLKMCILILIHYIVRFITFLKPQTWLQPTNLCFTCELTALIKFSHFVRSTINMADGHFENQHEGIIQTQFWWWFQIAYTPECSCSHKQSISVWSRNKIMTENVFLAICMAAILKMADSRLCVELPARGVAQPKLLQKTHANEKIRPLLDGKGCPDNLTSSPGMAAILKIELTY